MVKMEIRIATNINKVSRRFMAFASALTYLLRFNAFSYSSFSLCAIIAITFAPVVASPARK
jgi:hypothetical protein